MRALFIDRDPVTRGMIRCLATMIGLECDTVSSGREAMVAILQGHALDCGEPWSAVGAPEKISVVVLDPDLVDLEAVDLIHRIRKVSPETMIFAHAHAEDIRGGELYDRVFFKPHGVEAAVRAALGVVSDISDRDLLHCVGGPDSDAA